MVKKCVTNLLADLHIHTALSPCADEQMTPPAIVQAALEKGLAMIAICDHNSAGNARSVRAAAGERLTVLAGMEITTAEEVHVLGIFPDVDAACACGSEVAATLPALASDSSDCDLQRLMDAEGRTIGSEPVMLSAATRFSLEQIVALIKRHGGLAIASHADRRSFSVTSQLGFFPSRAGFDAIDIQGALRSWTSFGLPVIRSSDSHYLTEIGSRCSSFPMTEPTFEQLRSVLRQGGGYFGSA